jgi:1-acyl-sn-glycerol-3-phosphate acyltransferase
MALLDNMRAARGRPAHGGPAPSGPGPEAGAPPSEADPAPTDPARTEPEVHDTLWARLWSLLVVSPGFILSTAVHGLINHVVALSDTDGHKQLRIARRWARSLLWIAGVDVKIEGLERLRPGVSYILVANHLSYIDTPVLLTHLPVEFRFLAKEELFRIPFMGWHLHRAGHIPVPLEDPRGSVKTLMRAAEMIRRQAGLSLLIFPEGGRSMNGQLQEFIDGASYLAIKAQAPVVPMALIGTREILAMGSSVFHRGRVILRIGEPIPTEGFGLHDRKKLTEMAREQVVEMLARR